MENKIKIDKERFLNSCKKIRETALSEKTSGGIGTLSEKTLHAVIKDYLEPQNSNKEVKVGRFVADAVGENGIFEIQTAGFSRLKKKLECFLPCSRVTVVYPVAACKRLRWLDMQTGELSKSRKSPKKGRIYDALYELYNIREFLSHPNMRFCVMLVDLEEIRYLNGWSKDKKKGSQRCDRLPIGLVDIVEFSCAEDYLKFLPFQLWETEFCSKDYEKAAKISRRTAWSGLKILQELKVAERVGKSGNAYIYAVQCKAKLK